MSTKSTFKKNGGYFIDGVAYMDCKVTGEPVANVGLDLSSVIGSKPKNGRYAQMKLNRLNPKQEDQQVGIGWLNL